MDAGDAALSRYRDAYRVAISLTTIGAVFKAVAIVLAIIVALIGLYNMQNDFGNEVGPYTLMRILLTLSTAFTVWFVPFLAGVLISASGQILKAVVDSAVHTSPFLSLRGKAMAMSIPTPPESIS